MLPKAADEAAVRAVFQPFGEITEVRADGEAWKETRAPCLHGRG